MLTGTSSSGKTSLARELHRLLPEPAWLFVADDCFPHKQSGADQGDRLEPAIVVFHRAIAQWAASGRNVIIDGALPHGRALRTRCIDELSDFTTYIVAVSCSVEELRRREVRRPDPRPYGWAEQQHRDNINDDLPIALHVDTTTTAPADAARRVLDWLTDVLA